jgi:hypothetical protein
LKVAASLNGFITRNSRLYVTEATERYCLCARAAPSLTAKARAELEAYRRRLHELAEQMAVQDPDNPALRRWAALVCLGECDEERTGLAAGRVVCSDEADDRFRQATTHFTVLVRLQPGTRKHRQELISCLCRWALLLESGKQFARMGPVCARLLAEVKGLGDSDPTSMLEAAEVLARCSATARQDNRVPLPVREKAADRQDDRVVDLLRYVVKAKPELRAGLAARAALAGLRQRADFKALLAGR